MTEIALLQSKKILVFASIFISFTFATLEGI